MKLIKAIIQPHMLGHLMDKLHEHPELPGVTISEIAGFGRQRARDAPQDRCVTIGTHRYAKKIKLEIVVGDEMVAEVQELIVQHARTGRPGDGVVFVSAVESATMIRTGTPACRDRRDPT